MNPYLLTITFLMMMSILTSSKVLRYAESSLSQKMYEQRLDETFTKEEFIASSHIDVFRKKEMDLEKEPKSETSKERKIEKVKQSPSLKFNFSRPPDNSRLNLYLLLYAPPNHTPLYDVAARLMRHLYGDQPFFQKVSNAETSILDQLIEFKEECKEFSSPDELASLTFSDPELQEIFYQMLKGSKEYPSLLNYITFDKDKQKNLAKVNLMFASPELLSAILQDDFLLGQALSIRERYWNEILYQEEHRDELSKDQWTGRQKFKDSLKADLEVIDERFVKQFDLSLGHIGSVLLYEDPETGLVMREKAPRKKTKNSDGKSNELTSKIE